MGCAMTTESLAGIFARLQQRHMATQADPLPPATPGVTWLWAGNGIFKRGVTTDLDLLIQVRAWQSDSVQTGLANLLPHIRSPHHHHRLPGKLLEGIASHARRASAPTPTTGVVHPIEQQYHIIKDDRVLRVRVPPQTATAAAVTYAMPTGQVLVDVHSHHAMAAFFSATDDHDDLGLSISAVIGQLFTRPTIVCRLNVYGHHQPVPATMIFDSLGPFLDKGVPYARAGY